MNHLRLQVLATLLLVFAGSLLQADERPNLIVLLCDDLGYGDLECYGHPHIKTPHLNQLAADGIRLTACYSAAPVCSPSRVGLLTGRSPNRAGVFDWIPPAAKPKQDAREQVHMRRNEITMAQLLHSAGYQTCLAGKWHCNSQFNQPTQPQPGDFGFDHWLATQNNAAPNHNSPSNFVRNGEPAGETSDFSCQLVVDEAMSWLDNRDQTRPFFLFIPFHEPHEPVASPESIIAEYRDSARNDLEAEFFANVTNVDRAVGRLLDYLEKEAIRDNTLIVFTSDNGPETLNRYRGAARSYGQPGPLRGMKLHTHEAGVRVAGIINWPDSITPGQVIDTPVSSLDLLPTFCALAQADIPQSLSLDGTNILPLLQGNPLERPKPLVWAYYNAINQARVAMRIGPYKVLAQLDGGQLRKLENITTITLPMVRKARLSDVEVYNVTNDIGESTNLAETDPELATRMLQRLQTEYDALLDDSHVWTPQTADSN